MKISTKAILLSALMYPGAGQLYLKKYLIATVLVAATTAALYVLLIPVIAIANELNAKVLSGELQVGPNLITDVLAATRQATGMQSMDTTSLVLLATWLISVIHAWRVGKIQDHQTDS